ncbi:MAG: GAF domain-containing protein [Anaerolineales bacterium]|nr:GAF domain-containing protein [Anaerolineales bacterium]
MATTQSVTRANVQNLSRLTALLSQGLQWGVLLYQIAALGFVVISVFFAARWIQEPFIGVFYEQTLIFNDTGPDDPAWAFNQKVASGDQLIAVNHTPVQSYRDVRSVIEFNHFVPGDTIPVTVKFKSGETRDLNILLHPFPASSVTLYFLIPLFISAVFLLISFWIFGLRRNESAGRAFSVFASSLALATGLYFNISTSHEFVILWLFGCAATGGALIALAMSFPQEPDFIAKHHYLRWSGMLVAGVLIGLTLPNLYNFNNPTAYIANWANIYLFIVVSFLIYIGTNIYYAVFAQSPVVKVQSRAILAGGAVAFTPIGIWLMIASVRSIGFSPYLFLPTVILPMTIGYAILRFKLLRADEFIRRGILYSVFTVIVVLSYALFVASIGVFYGSALPNNSILVGVFIFLFVVFFEPLRAKLQTLIDTRFLRGERVLANQLDDFTHQLSSALDLNLISSIMRTTVASALNPSRIHLYTYDSINDLYYALPDEERRPTSDIRFAAPSPLVRYFHTEHLPLYLDNAVSLPAALQSEQARVALLGARLFITLPGKERPGGWLALGARLSGKPYTPADLKFLETICDQASIAMERVQTISHLERRIQEMNALTRVSQGVNVTLTFDDVLELIYAQTAQIIPTSHLHITLYEKNSDYYYYGFCVENNERIPSRENIPFTLGAGLAPEVIRKSRPLMTQDYLRECQARNVKPVLDNSYAWMGVPLNAGAESIGALSIGSRDGGTVYTRGQLELLQAIADQTAGAIVKARLLEESQQRARQLTTLNEITRQLTGTLELDPLLQNILENAVGILNSEAGSLFLVDDQTDELIFRVTVGPVATNLIGQRLPAGTGIVGRAVQTRLPVIENEEHNHNRFEGIDQQTGFVSRSLMAVPLQVKDHVIGVVEVINRRDGLPFVHDDQTLLTAFAGQAAVAIENARLYTLTDQELNARVEELSVMQRIDRELNASLEMDRAMRITLDWALRQSQAEAGLIGMMEENKLRVMSQQGLEEKNPDASEQLISITIPAMLQVLETGLPQRVSVADSKDKLYPLAHTQMVIPIRRETAVIGLLHLESVSDSLVDMSFLARLTDHAAIAISNAQLYGEVQRANVAKSDFVSFVAHELKNPMTSIKGYTELLAGGAVGQINDMQTNFLQTIKSNVERMSTLVSDLNDNSKIEAGRLRLDFKATTVAEIVDDVVRSIKRQVEEKKQTLELALPENLPTVWTDRIRAIQVLTNLVSNAYKYTPESGQIQIGAEETENHWDAEGASKVVHLWVKDDGLGMTEEDKEKIFQKFFRSDDPKARESPGTGLGLNITKSLVEMQGGKIWFDSEYRRGTTFHFTIPAAET